MKRVILGALVLMMLSGQAFASQTQTTAIDKTMSTANTTAEGDVFIADAKRVSVFTTIVNNRTTAAVTLTVTMAYSVDGLNWQDISWMDVAGGVTPQTTESTTLARETYIGWVDNRLVGKYLRIRVDATELGLNANGMYTSADNAALTVTVVEDK